MRDIFFCHKVNRKIPLLTEEEYNQVVVHLKDRNKDILTYAKENGCSLWEARAKSDGGIRALDAFEALTGTRLEHPEEIYVARLSYYGGLCLECSKPFRTPRAKFCAECGFSLPEGEVAGPLRA